MPLVVLLLKFLQKISQGNKVNVEDGRTIHTRLAESLANPPETNYYAGL